MRHCVQSFLRLTEEWGLVTDAGVGYPAGIWSVHRAVVGFSSTALDVTQLGQRQEGVASLLLARGARGWSF